jgi:beta-galactosidase
MVYFGCDYYPEQWAQWLPEGEARWSTDAQMMADAGFNAVRLAEFAWGLLEPARDRFDFAWLERVVDVLDRQGLGIVLCTPTAAPPPWLLHEHPDITQVTAAGQRKAAGTRREACANHPIYQERSKIICERLAHHFGEHLAVVGWQTDNEFGCHDSARCYCDYCQHAFRLWLERKYGDIAALNHAWGGSFWGETYGDWAHIPIPRLSSAERNPSQMIDFFRFSSDVWRNYHNGQIDLLRRFSPGRFVTHNFMGFFSQLNTYEMAERLDFASWDNYHYYGATPGVIAATHDHMWGVLRRNFWVIEQQAGQINWSVYNPATLPDFVRLKTYQAVGHGADGILYFRWRQALAGSEQYHSGLLDYAGRTTAGYTEAQEIGAELQRLASALEGTTPRPQVAILLDYDSRWSLQLQPHNRLLREEWSADHVSDSPALRVDRNERREYQPLTGGAHQGWPYLAPYIALWERNTQVAIISPDEDLTSYKVVCAPFLQVVRPNVAENLRRFVAAGGVLILGPRSGFKDEHNKLLPAPQPGPLADLTGTTVRFFDSLEPDRLNVLRWEHAPAPHRTEVGVWAEVLDAHDADVLARYSQGWYAGEAAITSRQHTGGGAAIHIGCMGGPALYENLFSWLLPQVGVNPLLAPVGGVEACAREDDAGRRVVFLLNHSTLMHNITLAHPVVDLISGQAYDGQIALRPGQVVVYEE